jgi:dephospho-CoA kinase
MLTVGLTGGIGSGKSTVAQMLASRGAVIIDADALARDAVVRGTPGFDAIRARFGDTIVTSTGDLDRSALADVVFSDDDARHDLEAIVHPEVRLRIAQVIADHAGTDDVVVLDSPLLIESGAHRDVALVVVVSTQPQTQIDRLRARGMSEDDARARIATQLPLDEKVALADIVLDNEGSLDELERQVDRLWERLTAMRP